MTRAEQKTLEQVDQKVDDLIDRFDRFVSTMKWAIGTFVLALGSIATLVLAVKK